MKARSILILCGVVWAVVVGLGLKVVADHQYTPGIAATSTRQWPRDSGLRRASDRATLVMLAHPKCPCTRASIGELALLAAHCGDKISTYVLFLKPRGAAAGWEKTDLWHSAAVIPGVQVVTDPEGLEARRFGAATSGQTLLYDAEGRLLFSGGITGSRGHSGDNLGRSAIVSLVTTGTAPRRNTPVFGCSIHAPDPK